MFCTEAGLGPVRPKWLRSVAVRESHFEAQGEGSDVMVPLTGPESILCGVLHVVDHAGRFRAGNGPKMKACFTVRELTTFHLKCPSKHMLRGFLSVLFRLDFLPLHSRAAKHGKEL